MSDQRDHRKDQKQVDEKTADVKKKETTSPQEDQHNRED
jgi:hypothetical protein